MTPRVVIPLLLALAAAAGLVFGAVLPGRDQGPALVTSGASASPTGDQSASPTGGGESSASPSDSGSTSPNADFAVTGDGGGVAAENQPQPAFPAEPLAPGEDPPQFVVISFDGACNNEIYQRYMDVADRTGAKYTFFVSGLCLLPEDQRLMYQTPGRDAGSSAIGFADDSAEVQQRIVNLTRAYNNGHEIGTHFLGHWCEPNEGSVNSWNTSEWQSEFSQDAQFMNDWAAINGVTDPTPLPFNHSVVQGARTPCLEGQRDVMYPLFVQNGFTYDASNSGLLQWPSKNDYGLWDFPLQTVKVIGYDRSNLSMDYNFLCAQNDCQQQAEQATCDRIEQSTYDSLMAVTDALYNGNRAPLFFGNHFNTWVCGAYTNALTRYILDASAKYPELKFISNKDLVAWLEAQSPATLTRLRGLGAQAY